MKIKAAIRTTEEIDVIVSSIQGTWVRRRNARQKLVAWSNELVAIALEAKKKEITRALKVDGLKECQIRDKRSAYTALELKIIKNKPCTT